MPPQPPIYANLCWPATHFLALMGVEHKDTACKPEPAQPISNFAGHCAAAGNAVRAFALACFAIYVVHGGEDGYGYPAYGRAAEWDISWMWPILVRNLIGCYAICGWWDYMLLHSSLAPYFAPYKLFHEYPTFSQLRHDAFVATGATICGSALEMLVCHHMALGNLPYERNLLDNPLKSLFWALFLTHIREPHFYLVHRMMHPWRTKNFPDIGRWMYVQFHSTHHKSYNTTAFSGTNMHPVEATIYYSACVLALPFGCHPAIFLGIILDCGIAAWLGHAGFVFPGTGDYYHHLHHMTFDCNYGTPNVPLDYWMGTFSATENDVKKIWQKAYGANVAAKVGREGNETRVHANAEQEAAQA